MQGIWIYYLSYFIYLCYCSYSYLPVSASTEDLPSPSSTCRDRSDSMVSHAPSLASTISRSPSATRETRKWSLDKEQEHQVLIVTDAFDGKVCDAMDTRRWAAFMDQFLASQNTIKNNVDRLELDNKQLSQVL